jgi:hypothetical protein
MSNKKNQIKGICKIGKTLSQCGIGNPEVLALILRGTTRVMKDRRAARGGAKNHQAEFRAECD